MLRHIIKTVLILTIGCSLLTAVYIFFASDLSFGYFLYTMLLVPFTVYLGPIILLTLIYSFIYKTNPNQTSKRRRILVFIPATAIVIVVWYLVEIFDWQSDFSLWTTELIKDRVSHSEMNLGVIIFIPLCIVTSYLFDNYADKANN